MADESSIKGQESSPSNNDANVSQNPYANLMASADTPATAEMRPVWEGFSAWDQNDKK